MNRTRVLHGVIATFVVTLFVLVGCSKSDPAAPSTGGATASNGNPSTPAAPAAAGNTANGVTGQGDADAVTALRNELAKHWLQTPDGWLSEYPSHLNMAGQRMDNINYYRQMKSLNFEIETGDISATDKLNGISYLGFAKFEATSLRKYNDPDEMGPPRWSNWEDMSASVQIEKKNGKWDFAGTNGQLLTGAKPSAAVAGQLK